MNDDPHPYGALAALAPGVTVVTANKRLARALQREYAAREQAAGQTVWETPDILPWRAWLKRAWDALTFSEATAATSAASPPALLLSPLQEHALWRAAMAGGEGEPLLRPDAAARLAAEAHALRQAWRIDPAELAAAPGRDTHAFLLWSREFEARCRAHHWIEGSRLPDALARAFGEGMLAVPAGLYLTGFDEFTPQQCALFDALAAAGTRIEVEPPPAPRARVALSAHADTEAEMIAAAHWARRRLEEGASRIAVVVPDLASCRASLMRILDDVLEPAAVLPGAAARSSPYGLSLGLALAGYPVVHAALTALEMLAGDLSLARAGALLRSPFIAGAETEMNARGLLDAALRQRGEATVSAETLAGLAGSGGEHACPLLAAALRRWRRVQRALPSRLAPSAWVERVLSLLQLLGWPGERPLDSDEYQTVEAWRELVCGLAGLDRVTPMMELRELLRELRRVSSERVFQPEREEAPIQVLGMLEAAGMRFDGVWVMGMRDDAWPPPPDPNPFLPLSVQRRHGLPRATPERELELARRLGRRLEAAAPEVRFSHALAEGDRPLRASPLLAHLPATRDDTATAPFFRERVQAAGVLETVEEGNGPAFTEREAPGGSRLFQLQALCPFRAFAELRLHAQPLEEAATGPDARERGTLMHRALDLLWRELGGSAALQAFGGKDLDELIGRVVDAVLAEAARDRPDVYTERFREVERWRLARRLRDWLEIERGRAPFVVEQREERQRIAVGGLEVEVRIDRLDRLADGRRTVIDYKTGAVSIDDWFGDRPEEPQLPLYSMALGEELDAVLFACLRPGDIGYVGVAQSGDVAPGKSVKIYAETPYAAECGSWDGQRREWARVLAGLAADFRAGRAAVDPKNPPQTCDYCALTALCRINELAAPLDDEEAPA